MINTLQSDLRNGMKLEDALIKHNTNLKTVMGDLLYQKKSAPRKRMGEYIYRNGGYFTIHKYVDGKRVFFGNYNTLEQAQVICEELIRCNWNRDKLKEIQEKHGIYKLNKQPSENNMYITRISKKGWRIQKQFRHNHKTTVIYGGYYNRLWKARLVRDELVLNGWDTSKLEEIKQKHGI